METQKAKELGKLAFEAGKSCIPAWDEALTELLNPEVGTNEDIYKAWIDGWVLANLATPIE